MSQPTTIELITELLNKHYNGNIVFDSPIRVKKNPHSWPVIIHGVLAAPGSGLCLKDADGDMHRIVEQGDMAMMIANSIHQRLMYLTNKISNVTSDQRTGPGTHSKGV